MANHNQTIHNQLIDQAAKGGVLGVLLQLCFMYDVNPALVVCVTPVIAVVLSWASTKVGDPTLASFIGSKPSHGKPVIVRKVAKKKAAK